MRTWLMQRVVYCLQCLPVRVKQFILIALLTEQLSTTSFNTLTDLSKLLQNLQTELPPTAHPMTQLERRFVNNLDAAKVALLGQYIKRLK